MLTKASKLFKIIVSQLIAPNSDDEDSRRREFILNIILLSLVALSGVALIDALSNYFTHSEYTGMPLMILAVILVTFAALLGISKRGAFKFSAYFLLFLYFLAVFYTDYKWSANSPSVLISFALLIVMSSILISTAFSFVVSFVSVSAIIIMNYLHLHGIVQPDLSWKILSPLQMGEAVVMAVLLLVITILSWLSNREIENSLKRAHQSEADLKAERDLLEVKVEERTRELKRVQAENVSQLFHLAEFGRLSAGIFHDLINPLTAVSLNLNRAQSLSAGTQVISEAKTHLDDALVATKRMEGFVTALRRQIGKGGEDELFILEEEIRDIIQVLSYRSRREHIEIVFSSSGSTKIHGDPVKFSRVLLNLISNALDSYDGMIPQVGKPQVVINLAADGHQAKLSVNDFGCGIPLENLTKVFEPYFSTKRRDHGRGIGIGLSSSKDIVEQDFGGTITVSSKEKEGTEFVVTLPFNKVAL